MNPELIPKDFTELEVQPKLQYKFLQQLPELKVFNVSPASVSIQGNVCVL